MSHPPGLAAPLVFTPVYQTLVWGGRRMEQWRPDLPPGPIGESWDVADHERGMSVLADGELRGNTLRDLVRAHGQSLIGKGFRGGPFPLMVKLIDATDRLSIQVHPDDALARKLGVGDNGKTECWLMLADGGELYQGTRVGVTREIFAQALTAGSLVETLNRFEVKAGDFFFLEARTVHALGAGCLLFEIQQTSDVTFRVYDWGRMGLDGKPRAVHVSESLEAIDFGRSDAGLGPRRPPWQADGDGGEFRWLVDCPSFKVEERRSLGPIVMQADPSDTCTLLTCLEGTARVSTAGGSVNLMATHSALVAACAGPWRIQTQAPVRLLASNPKF